MSDLETVGEKLANRKLGKVKVAGVWHYTPGQYAAEIDQEGESRSATMSYVDNGGHVCVVICAETKKGWEPAMILRAGFYTAERPRLAPDDFELSDKMLVAIRQADCGEEA